MADMQDTSALSVSFELDGRQPSLVVAGIADECSISGVAAAVDRLAEEHDRCICLDLSGVESMDTAAIGVLAGSAAALHEQNRRIRLKRASSPVNDLLDRLCLAELFCIEHERAGECTPAACTIASETCETAVFTLPCHAEFGRQARGRIDSVACAMGFSEDERDDIRLAVGEAVANAVEHGGISDLATFTVSCIATRDKVCITVSDHGPGFDPAALTAPQPSIAERGRGIPCINTVMDEVSFHFNGGTAVRMVKYGG